MTELQGAIAPVHTTHTTARYLNDERRRIAAAILPLVGSFGGGASYPTSFVGDSEPSVGISDPGAALRLAARVRGLDSAEFTSNGPGKGRRRSQPRTQHQLVERQQMLARDQAHIRARQHEDQDRDTTVDALTLIGLV